jgi:hypothetical protein
MAKTGATPTRKPKGRASRAVRPSFKPVETPATSSPWAYRTDSELPVADGTAQPQHARAPMVSVPSLQGAGVTRALDVLTLPIALSLMAVLAPMRRLLGPSSRH